MLDDLERLLACDSTLSRQVRCLLRGFHAGLEEASILTPQDPATTYAERILGELQRLLAPANDEAASLPQLGIVEDTTNSKSAPEAKTTLSEPTPVLESLAQEMFGSPLIQEELGSITPPNAGTECLWRTVQHSLLRLSAAKREDWRPKWENRIGEVSEAQLMHLIPADREEVVYPPFGNVTGLALTSTAPLHARLGASFEPVRGDAAVQVVSALLWFIDHEPALRHVYRPLYSFGFATVDERFSIELVERLRRVQLSPKETDPVKHLRTRIDLDEAIHSLTFDPFPAPDSWWRSLQKRSRDQLFELRQELVNSGLAVHLQVLTDNYAEIRNLSKDDLGVDRGGKPGEVVCCLRIFAKIDQQVYPGRVLYRRP